MHFVAQLLFSSLLLIELASADGTWTAEQRDSAGVVVIVCIVVGVAICLSASGGGAAFYMMRKRNNNQGQVMVVQ